MRLHTLFIATVMTAGAMVASGMAQTSAQTDNTAATGAATAAAPGDSVAADTVVVPSVGEILTDSATRLYKDVKFMAYDGELESVLYKAALDATVAAAEAFGKSETPELVDRNRAMLIDLNPMLQRGAVYYSTAGDSDQTGRFARAYIDVQLMPGMENVDFKRDPVTFPSLAYTAAYGASQVGDIAKSVDYFTLYLDSGDKRMRENVFIYVGQACLQLKDYAKGYELLEKAIYEYPSNFQITLLALQCCIDGGYIDRQQPLLDRALMLNPNDERLLNIQANVHEAVGSYKDALTIYQKIAETHPNSLENTRRIASCQYNLGASYYNTSIMESDEKAASRARRQSAAYFAAAKQSLEMIMATTPSDLKYLTALARTYAALGMREAFDSANTRVEALGGKRMAFNDMPDMMGISTGGGRFEAVKVPSYEEFARPYIEERLGTWAGRGEFERLEDYRQRLAGGEGVAAYDRLCAEAADAYLERYAHQIVLNDLRRSDYDIDNETYRIDTPYGPTVVKVPFKGNEAQAFKAGWEAARIRSPRFIIRDDKVAIAEITYVVNGRKYTYNSDDAATYTPPKVYVDVNGIIAAASAGAPQAGGASATAPVTGIWAESDVDKDIPVTSRKADNLFALIIANENYDKAADVFGALHDGSTMREYCVKTLGIPEANTISLNNATGNQVRDALEQLRRRVKGYGPEAEVIFYYAGHGLPDDATKEAYMMPVDANPRTIATLLPMREVYASLGQLDASAVQVFIDACFSGESRSGSPLVEARGVALKAKEVAPEGNMYVLSAASAQETAMPYKEKHHGLFTYFLLKKLQESKGNATLKEISDYVIRNVRDTSNSNPSISKEQNPTVATSGNMSARWEKKKLK